VRALLSLGIGNQKLGVRPKVANNPQQCLGVNA
jgi:hypothetical protein